VAWVGFPIMHPQYLHLATKHGLFVSLSLIHYPLTIVINVSFIFVQNKLQRIQIDQLNTGKKVHRVCTYSCPNLQWTRI